MSQFGTPGGKNPPWARTGQQMSQATNPIQQGGQMQQHMLGQAPTMGTMSNPTMLQYPQTQMFQQTQMGQMQQAMSVGGMTTMATQQMSTNPVPMQSQIQSAQPPQVFNQLATVSYPTRQQLNAAAFSPAASGIGPLISNNVQSSTSAPASTGTKQRVFTGIVTKVQGDFGFVDEDVFFPAGSVVKGSNPSVGDRVLVEAVFNATMPFKWNATRVQVLPMSREERAPIGSSSRQFSSYNAVPPPVENSNSNTFNRRQRRRDDERSRRDEEAEAERKKRREERREREEKEKEKEKERVHSPSVRKRSKTPPRRRRIRVVPRYMIQIPKIALDMPEADVMEIRRRYNNLYIPSDFFVSSFRWVDVFPPHRSLTLERPCLFGVMHKDVDPLVQHNDPFDPPDADYIFSAKVMLLSMPELSDVYKRCCSLAEDKDSKEANTDFVHPTRLINFLVGLRGKSETMAIGGPWSPSLDGPNPDKDPAVLIKTAIRTCKALTGIDLSECTQWFRFLEIYYRRAETVHKGKTIPAQVETVVLFLPDVWNCLPNRLEWDSLQLSYKKLLDRKLNGDQEGAEDGDAADEKEVEIIGEIAKKEPSHYAQLDPKTMKVNLLRDELEARCLSAKGLKSQLIARLTKALKTEQEKDEAEESDVLSIKSLPKPEKDDKEDDKKKKEEEEKKKIEEKDRALLEKRYTLPENPHILVHPSKTARSGKFDCTVMSLSVLLDYRQDDTKEHSFEVSLFAELFNEMLMRDFGFRIYRSLMEAPEKPKEEKDEKEKKDKEKEKDKKDKDKKGDNDKDRKERDRERERDRDRRDTRDDKRDRDRDREIRRDEEDDEDEDDDDDDDDDRKRDKKDSKKKRDRVKMITEDPYLLLSFVYFDQTHCGYVFDKDVEELLFTLGLNLSRAQVKKLVQKVVTRDSLYYRKLTDKPKVDDKDGGAKTNGEHKNEDIEALALGNKRLLPVFYGDVSSPPAKRARKDGGDKMEDSDSQVPSTSNGCVMYKGSLLDIEKLMAQMKRSEVARVETEKQLGKLRQDHATLKEYSNKSENNVKELKRDLKDFKERLSNTNAELCCVDAKTKLYFNTLSLIHGSITPLLQSKNEEHEDTIETVEMVDVMEEKPKGNNETAPETVKETEKNGANEEESGEAIGDATKQKDGASEKPGGAKDDATKQKDSASEKPKESKGETIKQPISTSNSSSDDTAKEVVNVKEEVIIKEEVE